MKYWSKKRQHEEDGNKSRLQLPIKISFKSYETTTNMDGYMIKSIIVKT